MSSDEYEYGLLIQHYVRRSKESGPFSVGDYLRLSLDIGEHWRIAAIMPPFEEHEKGTIVIEPWEDELPADYEADTQG